MGKAFVLRKLTFDHRSRVTRILIRGAFTDLLRQKPIQDVSVKELCELAGINRGTFYSHYTDLYDLLGDIEEDMASEFRKSLEPILSAEPGTLTPLAMTRSVFECLKNNSDLCTVTLGDHGDKEFLIRIIDIGRQMCVEHYSRLFAGVSPTRIEYFYAFISSGCIGLLRKWFASGMAIGVDELAAMAESLITDGIGYLKA
jgi:AcrR family transcriptional regulator